jgi:CDP-diacylglycerol--glycerol-3-phosphate 3-phosphatidyltransferase
VNHPGLLSGPGGDFAFTICFVTFFGLPFLAYLLLAAFGAVELPAHKRVGSGRRLLQPLFVGYYYWLLDPVFRFTERTSLRPNQITIASLMTSALAATAIASGHFALASTLLIGAATLDIIDGHLARAKGLATASGAFLDSTIDRICDGLIFGSCVVYYAGTPMMYVCLAVMIMSYTVSYARARGETLGIVGAEGLMQRAERITILGMALAFSPIVGHHLEGFVAHPFYGLTAAALCLLALLNAATAIARISWTMARLKEGPHFNLVRPLANRSPAELLVPSPSDGPKALNNRVS